MCTHTYLPLAVPLTSVKDTLVPPLILTVGVRQSGTILSASLADTLELTLSWPISATRDRNKSNRHAVVCAWYGLTIICYGNVGPEVVTKGQRSTGNAES